MDTKQDQSRGSGRTRSASRRRSRSAGHQRVLRCAGQTSVNENGEPQHAGDMAEQMALALDNLETVLKAADMTLANVVRLNLLHDRRRCMSCSTSEALEERLAAAGVQPAVTLLGVARLFVPDADDRDGGATPSHEVLRVRGEGAAREERRADVEGRGGDDRPTRPRASPAEIGGDGRPEVAGADAAAA